MLLAGWLFFVVFCNRLAAEVDRPDLTRSLLLGLPLSFATAALVFGGAFAGYWALVLWAVAVGMVGAAGFVAGGALGHLAAACEQFPPADPDAELTFPPESHA